MPRTLPFSHGADEFARDPLAAPGAADPRVQEELRRFKAQLHHRLVVGMDFAALAKMTREQLRLEVRNVTEEVCQKSSSLLNRQERDRLVTEVLDETFGLGPLESLMKDPTVSDILINGPQTVYVERAGRLELTDVVFSDEAHLRHIVQRIVGESGRRIDEGSPMVDARLPDGSRVNAIIPPLALDGALVSIRRFGVTPIRAEDLVTSTTALHQLRPAGWGFVQPPSA